ncbi:uncharacterized protein LY79DRAFT_206406 [Colletotrichum navitas]|uniref:Uncharacterized protein n=1 Tax=Colletotrichum navitas TaxID=681940 RepID=A0AAD8VC16_9PEZI|nr:uncharacterized protein LY79DRAFT_206406 [Colletotrichum navitas]KAK1599045.1 hypothetical protein LY79DRAFT_206406 [Colletotrichum navitas]
MERTAQLGGCWWLTACEVRAPRQIETKLTPLLASLKELDTPVHLGRGLLGADAGSCRPAAAAAIATAAAASTFAFAYPELPATRLIAGGKVEEGRGKEREEMGRADGYEGAEREGL